MDNNRTTRTLVMIRRPFHVDGIRRELPAGAYEITTEEELLGNLMTPAYRRVSTRIYVPPADGQIGLGDIVEIEPEWLESLVLNQVPG